MAFLRRTSLVLALVLFVLGVARTGLSQDKTAEFPIAVVNLDQVFNGYKKHVERLQPIRDSVKQLDESVQIRQVEIETTANQLRKATPGTPEQARLLGQATKLQNELRVYVEQERQKLQKREVTVLVATRREVDEQLKKLCQERGLKLVLRQYDNPDESQPLQQVLNNLNRDVVYQEGLDITQDVLKALNEAKAEM